MLKPILTFHLTCDAHRGAFCETHGGARVLTAYDFRNAKATMRKAGWKVNDGSRKKAPTFICRPCQLSRSKNGPKDTAPFPRTPKVPVRATAFSGGGGGRQSW